MSEARAEAAGFIDKWRARWPEWSIARVFVPVARREVAEAWFALLQEWLDAASTPDPAPGLAKLAWWQEELHAWAKGARRHPLGTLLQKEKVDWNALAAALPALMRRGDGYDLTALDRFACMLDIAERRLFDEDRDGCALISHELRERLGLPDEPVAAGSATRPRRLLAALAGARRGERALSPWKTLCCSWRAARR
ncbi:phytoene/squalene synthase family protein [Solilutibacter pythonis]|uniref:phytoene/squalene synthase family protein n=1 Tax=Solilutibacter pythonis TaxID=2483112 RepID=UPI0011C358C4|nr:phytoene/squalene synthase family protein [Lysobacter pythonis]